MSVKTNLEAMTQKMYGKAVKDIGDKDLYYAILNMTKEMMEGKGIIKGTKKVYYISAEFLIGKLLSNNLINLGIYEELASAWQHAFLTRLQVWDFRETVLDSTTILDCFSRYFRTGSRPQRRMIGLSSSHGSLRQMFLFQSASAIRRLFQGCMILMSSGMGRE